LSILDGMRLVDDPTYPGIARDYARSIERLRSLPAEVFLASHAGVFKLTDKRLGMEAGDGEAFIDPQGYGEFLDRAERALEERLATEAAEPAESTANGNSP
jgi:metallo-beta-lactamase class B